MILDQALRNATIHELAHPPNPFNHTHPPGASTHNPAGDTSLLIDYGSPSIVHAPIRVGTDAKRLSAAMEDFKHGRPYTPAGINMARGASGRRGVAPLPRVTLMLSTPTTGVAVILGERGGPKTTAARFCQQIR